MITRKATIAGHQVAFTAEEKFGGVWLIETLVGPVFLKPVTFHGNKRQVSSKITSMIQRFKKIEAAGIDPFFDSLQET